MRGVQPAASHIGGPPQHGGPAQAPAPQLGHGPSNLFGGIMANQGQGGPGLAPPPPQDQQQQPPQHQLQPPAPGPQAGPPPPQQQGSFPGYQPGPAVNGEYFPIADERVNPKCLRSLFEALCYYPFAVCRPALRECGSPKYFDTARDLFHTPFRYIPCIRSFEEQC